MQSRRNLFLSSILFTGFISWSLYAACHAAPTAPTTTTSSLVPIGRIAQDACAYYYQNVKSIVRGERAQLREFPFMFAVGWRSKRNESLIEYKCGGALVSPDFVLTAAHCLYANDGLPDAVRAGGVDLKNPTIPTLNIVKIIEHPDYDYPQSYNDIALLKVERPATIAIPACLWTDNKLDDDKVTVLGYGDTKYGGLSSERLLKAQLRLTSQSECEKHFEPDQLSTGLTEGLRATQICAMDPEKLRDTCQGDSGGPLLKTVSSSFSNIPYVVGITSFGIGCASDTPGIYTRVSEFVPWIESHVWPTGDYIVVVDVEPTKSIH